MNVHLIDFPTCESMIAGRDQISDMVEASLEAIARIEPTGPLYLLGYSLGGSVAYLTAKALHAQGRTIALLAILDNNVHRPIEDKWTPKNFKVSFYRNDDVQRLSLLEKIIETSAILLSHPKSRRLLSTLAAFDFSWLPNTLRFTAQNSIWEALQSRAFDQWVKRAEASPVPIEGKIIVSEHHRPNVPNDLGWSTYIRDVSIYPVKGNHHSMLRQPNREALVTLVAERVQHATQALYLGK
jgi:thioesterase domain-containing protein